MREMTYAEAGILQAQNKRIAELESQLAEAKDLLSMTVGNWVWDEDWAQRRDALLGGE